MASKDYYGILGVKPGASVDEIRKVYRKAAKELHPDHFQDAAEKSHAEETFSAMTEALNVLTDPDKRKAWEDERRRDASGSSAAEREAKVYFKNGVQKMNLGDYATAVELLKAALHLDAGPASYHAHMAKALEKTNAFGEAARSWEQAVRRDPMNAKYCKFAGLCMETAGMLTRARRMFASAVKWDPGDKVSAAALARLSGEKKGFFSNLFKKR